MYWLPKRLAAQYTTHNRIRNYAALRLRLYHSYKLAVNKLLEMEEISVKATGIVRRIDDLGRVVIPKEIRRTLRIRESDPLEIFTDHEANCRAALWYTKNITAVKTKMHGIKALRD